MTEAQKRLRELRERQSKERQRMAELAQAESLTDETRAELDRIETGTPDLERQLRAATTAVESEDAAAREAGRETRANAPDAETRERLELRSKASLGRYLAAAGRQRLPDGAEAELAQAAGLADGQIPLELWDVPTERRDAGDGRETRAVSAAPSTVGVNLDTLRPMVFAPSVVDRLNVDMPMVESGTFASGTITTAATAQAVLKGKDVPETAAAFTVATTTPHRVGASLNLAAEDVAAVGSANFESVLRQHISLALSDDLDDQLLNGDGSDSDPVGNLSGFFARLTDPTDPTAAATFDDFVTALAGGIDGLWASTLADVAILCGVATYRHAAQTFRDRVINVAEGDEADSARAAASLGDTSAADYAAAKTAGFWTNKRMPAVASDIQQAILCRKGRSMDPAPMRTAVCPTWGYLSVDDIYTGARKGERRYVVSVLVGDLILVQPDAYAQVSFKLA